MRQSEYLVDRKDFEIQNLRAEIGNLKHQIDELKRERLLAEAAIGVVMLVVGYALGATL